MKSLLKNHQYHNRGVVGIDVAGSESRTIELSDFRSTLTRLIKLDLLGLVLRCILVRRPTLRVKVWILCWRT